MINKIHFVDIHFDWKTKCNKWSMLHKKTIFKKCVTCEECLKLLKEGE